MVGGLLWRLCLLAMSAPVPYEWEDYDDLEDLQATLRLKSVRMTRLLDSANDAAAEAEAQALIHETIALKKRIKGMTNSQGVEVVSAQAHPPSSQMMLEATHGAGARAVHPPVPPFSRPLTGGSEFLSSSAGQNTYGRSNSGPVHAVVIRSPLSAPDEPRRASGGAHRNVGAGHTGYNRQSGRSRRTE